MAITVYRYDDEDYPDGKIIPSRGDHFDRLTATQQEVERLIRRRLGEDLRSTSLYTWETEGFARRIFEKKQQTRRPSRYLYELQVAEDDIRFRGDVDHFSAAETAIKESRSPDVDIERYCEGAGLPNADNPRVEVLVKKAKVVRKLATSPST